MKKNILQTTIGIFSIAFIVMGCHHKPDGGPGITKQPEIVKYKGDYICISLNQYIREYYKLVSMGATIPANMDTLYGVSWLDGYVVDKKNKDIILVGQSKKGWPAYHSEDIFVTFQNVYDNGNAPYCSLDPNPQNIKELNRYLAVKTDDYESQIKNSRQIIGGQKVVIGGVPLNSRQAKIMIYADYDMKRISQGLISAPDIKSVIDLSIADSANANPEKASMSRFWLHIRESKNKEIYPNFNENEGIVFINQCPVVVLTNKEYIDVEGKLQDNHLEEDKNAMAFSNAMSKNYESLATKNFLFAELENMFRLQACLRAMKFKDAITGSDIELSKASGLKLAAGNELPQYLPGLINYKILRKRNKIANGISINTRFFIVFGGVSQEMKIDTNNLTEDRSILNPGKIIVQSRPDAASVYWKAKVRE